VNATNRVLNRAALLIVGLLLVAVGGGVAAAALVPEWLAAWTDGADALDIVFDPSQVVTLVIVLAVCVAVIALLLVFVLRQGRGHTRTIVRRGGSDGLGGSSGAGGSDGAIVVDTKVAATLIEAALADHPAVASVSVSGYRVRDTPALKIAVSARRGASPGELREQVDLVVGRWDEVLGSEVPVLVTVA